MEDKSSKEQKQKDWEGFFEELQNESQRGGVIVGAAFLDEQLAELLRCFFIDDKKEVDGLINSGYSPLGSFGTRITTAYCLGLISKNNFHDLRIIKKIRNKFAHGLHGLSFEDEEIIKECNRLILPKYILRDRFPDTPGTRFLICVSMLASQIGLNQLKAKRERRNIKKNIEFSKADVEYK